MSYCRCSQQSQKMLSYRTLNFKYFCHIVKNIVFEQKTPSPSPAPLPLKKGSSWPKVQHFTNITTAKLIFSGHLSNACLTTVWNRSIIIWWTKFLSLKLFPYSFCFIFHHSSLCFIVLLCFMRGDISVVLKSANVEYNPWRYSII